MDRSDWRVLKISTNAGFAIGSPGAPHHVYASDQIRAAWVVAAKIACLYYICMFINQGNKSVSKCSRNIRKGYNVFLLYCRLWIREVRGECDKFDRQNPIGRFFNPRITNPLLNLASPAKRNLGRRWNNIVNRICISSRASGAPRQ